MALTTYTELQEEIADWLNREDLAAKIPTFIRLLEAQVERTLRTRDSLITESGIEVSDDGFVTLPEDFLSLQSIWLEESPIVPLTYASRADFNDVLARSESTAKPSIYTIESNQLLVAPLPDSDYTVKMSYWRKLEKLGVGDVTANWLLEKHPDIYLYGALLQAAPYLENDERVGFWASALNGLLEDLRVHDERFAVGGAPVKMRFKRAYG